MNKTRRKDLQTAICHLESAQNTEEKEVFRNEVTEAKSITETAMDEEQDYLDNLPENLQQSVRADDAQENIDDLSEAVYIMDNLNDEIDDIDYVSELEHEVGDAIDHIQNAIER